MRIILLLSLFINAIGQFIPLETNKDYTSASFDTSSYLSLVKTTSHKEEEVEETTDKFSLTHKLDLNIENSFYLKEHNYLFQFYPVKQILLSFSDSSPPRLLV